MASGLFSVGTSGLSAAYAAIQTTSHNITNAATPGFKRQQTIQSTPPAQFSGSGFIGQGVTVETIRRAYSEIISKAADAAVSRASEASTKSDYLQRLDRLLGDPNTGIGAALDRFFNSLQAAAAKPEDSAGRAVFVDQTRILSSRIAQGASEIEILRTDAARDLSLSIKNANDYGRQIAGLNDRIAVALASGQPPNDLLDQRDAAIRNLSSEIGVSTFVQDDGAISVFLGNGQTVIAGGQFNSLVVSNDPNDAAKKAIGVQTPNGFLYVGNSGSIFSGGNIASLLNIHNRDLIGAKAELGRLALSVATPLNTQHQRGLDADGVAGGNLFTLPPAQVVSSVNNTGNAVIGLAIADSTALKASDYRLQYDGVNYSVVREQDGVTQSFAALPATLDGVTISIQSGVLAAGDVFTLKPVSTRADALSSAIIDLRKLALALPVFASASASNTGSLSVDAVTVSATPNVNLQQPVTLTFTSPTTFDVSGTGTGNPTGLTYTPGGAISYNGWIVNLRGSPRAGDVVTVQTNP
ncbi:MAG: flagellar hook-associated protein FlgK, partial [Betaproteobacteria bacterium]|nr:flagellar hook-associated protein FlgK [Betaproteobacteria bacterium]